MENFVITVGRQFGSCGKEIGHALAKRFNIAFYDKELIALASKESGLCQEFFEKADEKNSGNLLQAFAAGFTFGPFQYNDFLSNDKLFQIQSDVIRKVANEHSCVIVGRCADYILRDNENCISVFISARMEDRIRRAVEYAHIEEKEAEEYIRKADKSRASYYNYYTDKIWGAAESYDLCISSSVYGIDETTAFIREFVSKR